MTLDWVEGAILAGGASSRMGRDKAGIEWRGVPMVERVARALGACVPRVRVVVRPGDAAPPGLERIEDEHDARAPIVGLCAALRACERSAVLVAACDTPEIEPRVLLALLALTPARGGSPVVALEGPRGPEPFPAVYRPSLLPEVERRIARGDLALQPLLRGSGALLVPASAVRELDPELRTLRNVNRPEDLGGA